MGGLRTVFAETVLLGIGFYSYIAAVLMAPVYLLFTRGRPLHQGSRRVITPSPFAGFRAAAAAGVCQSS